MTLRYAILGDPVAHSRSPIIQNAAFAHGGIDAQYVPLRVDEAGLRQAASDIRSGRLAGANVTMPHKQLAARLVDEVRGDGYCMRAVNTLWRESGRLIGASTDPEGLLFAWAYAGLPDDGPVLVLGAGGAAAAALVALGNRPLRVAARREESARAMVVSLGSDASVIPWGAAVPGCVVVNATPVGMKGEALPPNVVAGAVGLFEMTYGRVASPAESDLRKRKLPVATGEMMLVGQGAASFRLWTGADVPHAVMIDALATAESGT